MKSKKWSKKKILVFSAILILAIALIVVTIGSYSPNDNNQPVQNQIENEDNWYYGIDDEHVVITNEYGGGYINNRIVITFDDTTGKERINEIVNSIGGTIIGFSRNTYQIEIEEKTLDELWTLYKQLEKEEGVSSAFYEMLGRFCKLNEPNDPWKDTFQGIFGQDWDEEKPNGLNWWLETIEALSAWNYTERFANIKIGVADTGFDTQHEDLNIVCLNNKKNVADDHGTHVAGIIGATANNNIGITGVVWNKELYVYDASASNNENVSFYSVCDGIEDFLLRGCKIINISAEWYAKSSDEINKSGIYAIRKIIEWKENPDIDDFIIVQSAGNESYDSLRAGFFSSITEEAMNLYCAENGTKYSYEDIIQHIIVVGAVEQTSSGYQMTDFSNYGSYVSICAPGKDIFSTVVMGGKDGNYEKINGTSMAAPIVTGVTSLVWSVNPDFTAEEVKDIVCNYTNKSAKGYGDDTRTYPIVNAKLAVEEAIRRTDNAGTLKGIVKEKDTDMPLKDIEVTLTQKNGNLIKTVQTDENGTFEIKLPVGNWEITLSSDTHTYNEYAAVKIEKDVERVLQTPIYMDKKVNLKEELLNYIWYNVIQDLNEYQFYDDGTVIENYSDEMEYTLNNDILTLTWNRGQNEYSIKLKYVSKNENINWKEDSFFYENIYGEIGKNEKFFYEIDYVSDEMGLSNAMWLRKNNNSNACGDNLTWELTSSGELIISGNGEMYSYLDSLPPWHNSKDSIKKVFIEQGVTNIGDCSFFCCENLKEVNIGKSVKNIGVSAFYRTEITDITIPENVNIISSDAFSDCKELKKITILNPNCTIENAESSSISDTATIYGYENSTAQWFANEFNRTFVVLGNNADNISDNQINITELVLNACIINNSIDITDTLIISKDDITETDTHYFITVRIQRNDNVNSGANQLFADVTVDKATGKMYINNEYIETLW